MVARATVKTHGGYRLRAFLRAVGSGRVRQRYLELVTTGLNREFLPELRAHTPKVSGVLRRSYSIRNHRNGRISLNSTAPYATTVRFAKRHDALTLGERSTAGLAHALLRTRLRGIATRAVRRAIQEVT